MNDLGVVLVWNSWSDNNLSQFCNWSGGLSYISMRGGQATVRVKVRIPDSTEVLEIKPGDRLHKQPWFYVEPAIF